MWRSARRSVIGVALVVALSACTGGGGSTDDPGSGTGIPRGGTLRIGVPTWGSTFAYGSFELDPQAVYFPDRWELQRCCLLRTLLSYNGRPTEEGGAELRPDLAASMPEVSPDGLTWTFDLKPGLRYAPPLQRTEITAPDIIRAVERALTPAPRSAVGFLGPYLNPYSFYYLGVIQGTRRFADGAAQTISGMEAPDPHTLIVRLMRPVGDLGYRFSLPATAPIPPDPSDPLAVLGVAQGHDDGYGRFLVASGPYMFEASQDVDLSAAPAEQPLFEVTPGATIVLVRNPSWSPTIDDLRPAYVDRIELSIERSVPAAVRKVDTGALDLLLDVGAPTEQAERYSADAERARRLHVERADLTFSIAMNLAVPPFDDVHVRKAMNYAIDKAGLADLAAEHGVFGFSGIGEIAGHIAANGVEDNLLLDYDPYPTPAHRGSVEDARGEMSRSRYDTDRDGRCDAAVCRHLRAVTMRSDAFPEMAELISDNLRQIGITLRVDPMSFGAQLMEISDPESGVPLILTSAWFRDYPNGSAVFPPLFSGALAREAPSYNASRLGASPQELETWGYPVTRVPSVDGKIEECLPMVGQAQVHCWAELDQLLMEKVVPWVPYLFVDCVFAVSSRVRNYTIDQFTTSPALDRLALVPGSA